MPVETHDLFTNNFSINKKYSLGEKPDIIKITEEFAFFCRRTKSMTKPQDIFIN